MYRRQRPEQSTHSSGIRSTVNKWDLMKPNTFYKTKDNINGKKKLAYRMENIFTNSTSDGEIISKSHK